ncbi:T6SS phospholipase effector Tle1-like catalytic domain-containing protein [Acinetobacter indicus]|uniref:T6SS phospholipase effector Tle1-like catalytic domain-containing protein n=1 Tax=Acinetobacter indicus TaxID=756892 RepID=UPI00398954D7
MVSQLQKIKNSNQDVSNQSPQAKQDCADVVNISVFFDGTGNNLEADQDKGKLANPAKLWRNAQSYSLFEIERTKSPVKLNHPIYVSGVGTPFNGELSKVDNIIAKVQDHDLSGGFTGVGGRRRLEYGESQISKSLENTLKQKIAQAEVTLKPQVEARKNEAIVKMEAKINEHRLIKKVNLSIFGFSRGAALARVFSNEMIWKTETEDLSLKYQISGQAELAPMEIQFLGIFDTVASFGLPATNMPNKLSFKGRDMVVDPRVKNCLHLVAGNELRFAFPVDSIHIDEKLANPRTWKEIVYPGMHSDVGGGYEPNSQTISNNFARIPLKHMLESAAVSGVKVFGYSELENNDIKIFNEEFKIEEKTQQLFEAVQKAVGASTGEVKKDIINYMKLQYGAYGTLHRQRQQYLAQGNSKENPAYLSVSQIAREEAGFSLPTGPADMATEVERVKTAKNFTTFDQSNLTGIKHVFRIIYPFAKAYEFLVDIDDWELQSWEKNVSQEAVDFYSSYVHDSKYGFIYNAEPFSYFRQRTVYESKRSWKGKRVDKKLGPVHEQIAYENNKFEKT